VRRASVFVLLAVSLVLLGSGFRTAPSLVGPGDKIGTMTLVRGAEHDADIELWGLYCDAVIPKPGRYRRTCPSPPFVPRLRSLFIGYGDWERTRNALDSVWKQLKWELWCDGRRVNLSRFGTDDRPLYHFSGAGGKQVILREWSVIVMGVTNGKHLIRYRSTSRSLGTTDATWTFTVR
jgi:hypothetical protein